MDYILLFYSSIHKPQQRKLQVIQNRAIRLVCRIPKRSNVDQQHIKLKLWHIENRYWYFLMNYMFMQARLPSNPFIDTRLISTRRHAGILFLLPHLVSERYMNSFVYKGRVQWNCLPAYIQLIQDNLQFKAYLRNEIKVQELSIVHVA